MTRHRCESLHMERDTWRHSEDTVVAGQTRYYIGEREVDKEGFVAALDHEEQADFVRRLVRDDSGA